MKRIRIVAAAVVAFAALSGLAQIRAVSSIPWSGGKKDCWQQKRHAQKLAEITNSTPKVVFVGDSITHFWESNGKEQLKKYFSEGDWKMLDLGTSADRTEHVLWRIDNGELDGYEAKCIHLMIGTNNTGHFPIAEETPADTILGIREILMRIRAKQPKAKIILSAIFPRGERADDPLRLRNDVVNREIEKFCDGKTILWCDMTDRFLTPDGELPRELFPDLLHPNAKGYEIWYECVKPYIEYALSDGELPPPQILRSERKKDDRPAALVADTRIRIGWWIKRLLAKRNEIKSKKTKGRRDLVLFGDSITHFWEKQGKGELAKLRKKYSVLDIGYSGDKTEHLIWRAENGELDGYEAKFVMLMIGTNNAGGRKDRPEDTAAGIAKIIETIGRKQPKATILLSPIFPRGANAKDANRVINDRVNELIRPLADGRRVVWFDINDRLLDENGDTKWIMPDRLHPNAQGYVIWREALEKAIEEIGRTPVETNAADAK